MKFKDLKAVLDEFYIIIDTPEGRFEEFNTRSAKFDDLEVSTIQWSVKGIFVAVC